MPIEEEPVVGAVYQDDEGRSFEVISLDEDVGTVEVKYKDETVDEIDIDAWYEMELKRVVAPKEKDSEVEEDIDDDGADDYDDEDDEEDDDNDDDEEQ
jgi:hypothetical protein